MKKQNQVPNKKRTTSAKSPQQKAPEADLLIAKENRVRFWELAKKLRVDPKILAERVITHYLRFVEEYPTLAGGMSKLVNANSLLLIDPPTKLSALLDDICYIHSLDRNSIADTAVRSYIEYAGHFDFRYAQRNPGHIDPENIAWLLSRVTPTARSMFETITTQFKKKDFESACAEMGAFRELVMFHPGLTKECAALEMISEGAQRLFGATVHGEDRRILTQAGRGFTG